MDCSTADPDPHGELWLDSWLALERAYAEGLVNGIGVSNFDDGLLHAAMDHSWSVLPHVVQNYFALDHLDVSVVQTCREHQIYYQSYSLIRQGIPFTQLQWGMRKLGLHEVDAFEFLIQLVLRADVGVIIRSGNQERIANNLQVANFPFGLRADVFDVYLNRDEEKSRDEV